VLHKNKEALGLPGYDTDMVINVLIKRARNNGFDSIYDNTSH